MAVFKRVLDRITSVRRHLFRFNFYRSHLAFFTVSILVSSAIMYASTGTPLPDQDPGADDNPAYRIDYVDALFMCTSAMTATGLTSLDLSLLTGYQQSILFVLMWIGDLSTISISVVFIRRWFFQRRMSELASKNPAVREILEDIDCEKASRNSNHSPPAAGNQCEQTNFGLTPVESQVTQASRATLDTSTRNQGSSIRETSREAKFRQQSRKYASHERRYGGLSAPWEMKWLKRAVGRIFGPLNKFQPRHDYLSFVPKLDNRGRFRKLTKSQCQELGGAEYRALQLLSWILPVYMGLWVFITTAILTPYAAHYAPVATIVTDSQPGNTQPVWWGVFVSLSSYTNAGLTLTNSSMIPFQSNYLILIVSGAAILAGNTFYPIFLRFFIWVLYRTVPKKSEIRNSLSFLLQHPRRCYLFLFGGKATWILAAVQTTVILGEWVFFEILNINQTAVWALAPGVRTIDGLYQSLGTRSSGFYIVAISSIAPAVQMVYIVTMYMSAFPIIISLRQTNVYEERSIGLDADEYENKSSDVKKKPHKKHGNFLTQHIRNQLAYDLWWIILSSIIISIIEEPSLNDKAEGFDNFSILFEVVSGYGNCGLSLGVPYGNYSLIGACHALSKLVMVTVMLRGRHRILPMAIDRSILLPGQGLMEEMDEHYSPSILEEELMREVRHVDSGKDEAGTAQQDPKPKPEHDDALRSERGRGRAYGQGALDASNDS